MANSFASLFDYIKPIILASDALASVTSVSVTGPTADNIIFGFIFSISILRSAVFIASNEPCTSALITILSVEVFSEFPKISSPSFDDLTIFLS